MISISWWNLILCTRCLVISVFTLPLTKWMLFTNVWIMDSFIIAIVPSNRESYSAMKMLVTRESMIPMLNFSLQGWGSQLDNWWITSWYLHYSSCSWSVILAPGVWFCCALWWQKHSCSMFLFEARVVYRAEKGWESPQVISLKESKLSEHQIVSQLTQRSHTKMCQLCSLLSSGDHILDKCNSTSGNSTSTSIQRARVWNTCGTVAPVYCILVRW